MEIVWGIDNYQAGSRPIYLALGNFDGVHIGHQQLIKKAVEQARSNQGLAAALIFEPHPARVLRPEQAPPLLVNSKRKAKLLEALQLDLLVFTPFTLELSRLSPEEFVRQILVQIIKVREVFVGFNYYFGHKGQGDCETLKSLGEEYGFPVHVIPPVKLEGQVVSSSLIRRALEEGDVESAASMLGTYPVLEGLVVKGENRGAKLGFPTANLRVDPELNIPAGGVYAAWTEIDGIRYPSVVNIGTKPTFHSEYPLSVESHVLDFDRDIYDRKIALFFIRRLRGEMKFASVDALIVRIREDIEEAREAIGSK